MNNITTNIPILCSKGGEQVTASFLNYNVQNE